MTGRGSCARTRVYTPGDEEDQWAEYSPPEDMSGNSGSEYVPGDDVRSKAESSDIDISEQSLSGHQG